MNRIKLVNKLFKRYLIMTNNHKNIEVNKFDVECNICFNFKRLCLHALTLGNNEIDE